MLLALVIISGILAVIALVLPELIFWGLLFGILPGFLLIVAPTVFGYSATAWLIERALPYDGWPATITAWGISLGLGFAINQPRRYRAIRRFRAACQADITPPAPLVLQGEIALESPGKAGVCSPLCAALLDMPGVTGVTQRLGPKRAERWSLQPRTSEAQPTLWPNRPGEIADVRNAINHRPSVTGKQPPSVELVDPATIEDAWKLRLSTREVLVCEPTTNPIEADWTIAMTSRHDDAKVRVQTVTVRDREGAERLRRTRVNVTVPTLFAIYIWNDGSPGKFGWATQPLESERSAYQFAPLQELLRQLALPAAVSDQHSGEHLRDRIAALLDDPDSDGAALEVCRVWLAGQKSRMAETDIALAARVFADLRVPDPLVLATGGPVDARFREGLVKRILAPDASAQDRYRYGFALNRMPTGTFANPTEDEHRIWSDPQLGFEAAPFMERIADAGPEALPLIMGHLERVARIPKWETRKPQMRSLRRALCRLGRDAAPAIPLIRELWFIEPQTPLMQSHNEAEQWRMTLVLLGHPSLPTWNGDRPDLLAKEQERAVAAAARYDPNEIGYYY